jgi:hypothetical protein
MYIPYGSSRAFLGSLGYDLGGILCLRGVWIHRDYLSLVYWDCQFFNISWCRMLDYMFMISEVFVGECFDCSKLMVLGRWITLQGTNITMENPATYTSFNRKQPWYHRFPHGFCMFTIWYLRPLTWELENLTSVLIMYGGLAVSWGAQNHPTWSY